MNIGNQWDPGDPPDIDGLERAPQPSEQARELAETIYGIYWKVGNNDHMDADIDRAIALIAEHDAQLVAGSYRVAADFVRANTPYLQGVGSVGHVMSERILSYTSADALAALERRVEQKVRELTVQFADLAVELEKHSNDHIHDEDSAERLGAAVEGVCADRINAILTRAHRAAASSSQSPPSGTGE